MQEVDLINLIKVNLCFV